MRVFNKYAALNKLENKNNKKVKRNSIIVCAAVLIFAILYFSFARFESTQSFSLINGVGYIKPIPITSKMISLAANGATDLEYDGVDTLGELGTSDNNLRYVGANPNNYIYFNCSTTEPTQMNDTTCEKWRIVGLMNNVEDESGNSASRVKITREPFDTKYTFDSSDSSVNSGRGINQWGESTNQDGTPYEGSDIMRELNTDYLGNTTIGTDGKWYNGRNNEKTASMPERLLSSSAKDMVETVVWKVGSISIENGSYDSRWSQCSSLKVYNRERTEYNWVLYSDDNINRTTRWTGKISLIYASDYDYATSGGNAMNKNTCLNASSKNWLTTSDENYKDCFNNDWLRSSKTYYTLNMLDIYEGSHTVFALSSQGYSNIAYSYETDNIRPSLYLKLNVAITSGNGTESNPYKIVIDTSLEPR